MQQRPAAAPPCKRAITYSPQYPLVDGLHAYALRKSHGVLLHALVVSLLG